MDQVFQTQAQQLGGSAVKPEALGAAAETLKQLQRFWDSAAIVGTSQLNPAA